MWWRAIGGVHSQAGGQLAPKFPSFHEMRANPQAFPHFHRARRTETIVSAGQVLFVPGGTPHYVENLDNTIAYAGNFLDDVNYDRAIADLGVLGLLDPGIRQACADIDSVEYDGELGCHAGALDPRQLVVPYFDYQSGESARWPLAPPCEAAFEGGPLAPSSPVTARVGAAEDVSRALAGELRSARARVRRARVRVCQVDTQHTSAAIGALSSRVAQLTASAQKLRVCSPAQPARPAQSGAATDAGAGATTVAPQGSVVEEDRENQESQEDKEARCERLLNQESQEDKEARCEHLLERLADDGYVILKGALSPAGAADMRQYLQGELLKAIDTDAAGVQPGDSNSNFARINTRKHRRDLRLRMEPKVQAALASIVHGSYEEVYTELLPPAAPLVELGVITSFPGADSQTIHADVDFDADARQIFTTFVAVQSIDAAMGPTSVWPGTHTPYWSQHYKPTMLGPVDPYYEKNAPERMVRVLPACLGVRPPTTAKPRQTTRSSGPF